MGISYYISNKGRLNEFNLIYTAQIPESLSEQLYNSITKIQTKDGIFFSGFFMKLKINTKIYHFLISNSKILPSKIEKSFEITIIYGKKNETIKKIKLNINERLIKKFDNPIDIALIEILQSDKIPEDKYLIPDYNYNNGFKYFENNNCCSAGYSVEDKRFLTFGKILKTKNFEFEHTLDPKFCPFGSPICSVDNCCVIGMQKNYDANQNIKFGIFIGVLIDILEGKKVDERLVYKYDDKSSEMEYKINEGRKSDIEILDFIIKKDCRPNPDYYEFFNFLQIKNGRDYFIDASIFEKNIYNSLRIEYLNKLNNRTLSEIEKSCIGSMLGMAIGDAIGSRIEFTPLNYNNKTIIDMGNKPEGGFKLNPGQWTDNTSMGLCIADSLIEKRGEFDPKDIMIRFILWCYFGYNNTFRFDYKRKNRASVGLGGSIQASFDAFLQCRAQNSYTNSGNKNNSGNGSLMRNAAIPICYYRDEEKALDYAKKQSFITTQGIEAAGCCKLLTFIILKILKMKSLKKEYNVKENKTFVQPKTKFPGMEQGSLKDILDLNDFKCEYPSVNILAYSQQEGKGRNWNWKDKNFKFDEERAKQMPKYIGSYCMDGLSMALHVLYTTNNFKDAILKISNLGADSGSIASIVGQIAGAYYGLDSIPKDWIQTLNKWDNNEIALRGYILCHLEEKK